jgi:hypothetical protein
MLTNMMTDVMFCFQDETPGFLGSRPAKNAGDATDTVGALGFE